MGFCITLSYMLYGPGNYLSVQVSISSIDCARFRSTTVYPTSKFVRHGENEEQERVHCCRTATTQSLAYEKLRRICCFDLIFWENDKVQIIRFSLIIFMILFFTCKQFFIQLPFSSYKSLFIFTFHFSLLRIGRTLKKY